MKRDARARDAAFDRFKSAGKALTIPERASGS